MLYTLALLISLLSPTLLDAMEQPSKRVDIENNTNYPISIIQDYQELTPPLDPGQIKSLETPHMIDYLYVKYKSSPDLSKTSIDIKDILNKAQANDVRIRIDAATTYGVKVGKIEIVGSFEKPKEKEINIREENVPGLEESFIHAGGPSKYEKEAYRLLKASPTSSDYKILGVEPDDSKQKIEKAHVALTQALLARAHVPNELKEIYEKIIKRAYENLTKDLTGNEQLSYTILGVTPRANAYQILQVNATASIKELQEARAKRLQLLPGYAAIKENDINLNKNRKLREIYHNIIQRAYEQIINAREMGLE